MINPAQSSEGKMKYKNLSALFTICIYLLLTHPALAQSPLDEVKGKVAEITSVVVAAKKQQTLETEETKDKLWVIVDTVFDFATLSRKTLGRNWLAMNEAEKTEFVTLFRKLLGRTYLNRIKDYDNEELVFLRESFLSPENAEVYAQVESKGKPYAINFKLFSKEGKWKVYDVSIEGVSLLSNYRSQFNDFLRKNTMPDLIKKLKKKVEAPKEPAKEQGS
jgi:phospholipid transport system substrate-binding protein